MAKSSLSFYVHTINARFPPNNSFMIASIAQTIPNPLRTTFFIRGLLHALAYCNRANFQIGDYRSYNNSLFFWYQYARSACVVVIIAQFTSISIFLNNTLHCCLRPVHEFSSYFWKEIFFFLKSFRIRMLILSQSKTMSYFVKIESYRN